LIPLAESLINSCFNDNAVEKHEFEILKEFLLRIDENTAQTFFASKQGWSCYEGILKSKLTFLDQAVANSAVSIVIKTLPLLSVM